MGKEKRNKYNNEDMYKAIAAVEAGSSLRAASRRYNIPRSTLYTKLHGLVPVKATRGPATVLTYQEEELLVNWILYCSDRGFPVTKCFLLERVHKLVERLQRKNSFKENKPGRHWYESFCRRHPEISPRVAQNLSTRRISATKEDLLNWFQLVETHLDKVNLKDVDSSRVFNLDESAFFLCPKGDKVLARKGSRSVYKVVAGNEKESITVLFTVAANGVMLPPFLLFWYERLPANIVNSLPSGWICGSTERGWMTGESFLKYITGQFYPWLVKNKIQFPVVLFVDGHSSHLTLELATFCKEKEIELIALHPNATHILQPLDVAVFHPLKHAWKKVVDKWRMDQAQQLKRENFAMVLKSALDAMPNLPRIIQNGFATCGLSPFSPDAVDYDILNKQMTKKKKIVNNAQAKVQKEDTISAHVEEEEHKKHLEQLESRLHPEILSDFKEAVENKSLTISNRNNQGLFDYWLQSRRLCGASIIH